MAIGAHSLVRLATIFSYWIGKESLRIEHTHTHKKDFPLWNPNLSLWEEQEEERVTVQLSAFDSDELTDCVRMPGSCLAVITHFHFIKLTSGTLEKKKLLLINTDELNATLDSHFFRIRQKNLTKKKKNKSFFCMCTSLNSTCQASWMESSFQIRLGRKPSDWLERGSLRVNGSLSLQIKRKWWWAGLKWVLLADKSTCSVSRRGGSSPSLLS